MDEVGRSRPGRRHDKQYGTKFVGAALVVVSMALIVYGPYIMSRQALTGAQLFTVALGLAYGLYLAVHSRNTHLTLERAYSAHLEELSQRLRNMAYRDAVTGLYNHRYFREQLTHEIERSVRYAQPLSLILMDMNNFKQINDRYGHYMGDRFLGLVGEAIARQVRSSDVGARYGGDEFVIVLPNTTRVDATMTAEKLANAVANCAAMTATGETVQLGISFGVATCIEDAKTPSELIECADGRLYQAKALRKPAPGRSSVA